MEHFNKGKIRSAQTRKKISDAGKGRKQSLETIAKRAKSLMGKIPWNKGKKCPEISGEKSYNWKGDNVGYWGIHDWIRKELGRPMHCALCQSVTAKKYEWANISHLYKRELSDWVRLCTKCHIAYDKGKIKL